MSTDLINIEQAMMWIAFKYEPLQQDASYEKYDVKHEAALKNEGERSSRLFFKYHWKNFMELTSSYYQSKADLSGKREIYIEKMDKAEGILLNLLKLGRLSFLGEIDAYETKTYHLLKNGFPKHPQTNGYVFPTVDDHGKELVYSNIDFEWKEKK